MFVMHGIDIIIAHQLNVSVSSSAHAPKPRFQGSVASEEKQ